MAGNWTEPGESCHIGKCAKATPLASVQGRPRRNRREARGCPERKDTNTNGYQAQRKGALGGKHSTGRKAVRRDVRSRRCQARQEQRLGRPEAAGRAPWGRGEIARGWREGWSRTSLNCPAGGPGRGGSGPKLPILQEGHLLGSALGPALAPDRQQPGAPA